MWLARARVLATFHRAVLWSAALFLSGLFALLIITPVCAVDLFTCEDSGHILAFTVPDAKPVPATVDQAGATQAAVDWARRFYHRDDLDVLAVEFQTRPTRFWRVTFLASENGQTVHRYAVVLPDGRVVVPVIRDET
jgi:hypothetical protein